MNLSKNKQTNGNASSRKQSRKQSSLSNRRQKNEQSGDDLIAEIKKALQSKINELNRKFMKTCNREVKKCKSLESIEMQGLEVLESYKRRVRRERTHGECIKPERENQNHEQQDIQGKSACSAQAQPGVSSTYVLLEKCKQHQQAISEKLQQVNQTYQKQYSNMTKSIKTMISNVQSIGQQLLIKIEEQKQRQLRQNSIEKQVYGYLIGVKKMRKVYLNKQVSKNAQHDESIKIKNKRMGLVEREQIKKIQELNRKGQQLMRKIDNIELQMNDKYSQINHVTDKLNQDLTHINNAINLDDFSLFTCGQLTQTHLTMTMNNQQLTQPNRTMTIANQQNNTNTNTTIKDQKCSNDKVKQMYNQQQNINLNNSLNTKNPNKLSDKSPEIPEIYQANTYFIHTKDKKLNQTNQRTCNQRFQVSQLSFGQSIDYQSHLNYYSFQSSNVLTQKSIQVSNNSIEREDHSPKVSNKSIQLEGHAPKFTDQVKTVNDQQYQQYQSSIHDQHNPHQAFAPSTISSIEDIQNTRVKKLMHQQANKTSIDQAKAQNIKLKLRTNQKQSILLQGYDQQPPQSIQSQKNQNNHNFTSIIEKYPYKDLKNTQILTHNYFLTHKETINPAKLMKMPRNHHYPTQIPTITQSIYPEAAIPTRQSLKNSINSHSIDQLPSYKRLNDLYFNFSSSLNNKTTSRHVKQSPIINKKYPIDYSHQNLSYQNLNRTVSIENKQSSSVNQLFSSRTREILKNNCYDSLRKQKLKFDKIKTCRFNHH